MSITATIRLKHAWHQIAGCQLSERAEAAQPSAAEMVLPGPGPAQNPLQPVEQAEGCQWSHCMCGLWQRRAVSAPQGPVNVGVVGGFVPQEVCIVLAKACQPGVPSGSQDVASLPQQNQRCNAVHCSALTLQA